MVSVNGRKVLPLQCYILGGLKHFSTQLPNLMPMSGHMLRYPAQNQILQVSFNVRVIQIMDGSHAYTENSRLLFILVIRQGIHINKHVIRIFDICLTDESLEQSVQLLVCIITLFMHSKHVTACKISILYFGCDLHKSRSRGFGTIFKNTGGRSPV